MYALYSTACQANGKPYSPKTLLQLMTNLQRLALTKNASACHFMSHANPFFKELHNILNNISKKLLSGIGAEFHSHQFMLSFI